MLKSEKDILNIIKYLPVFLILLISSTLTYFLYSENQKRFIDEKKNLEEKYIQLNKEAIQYQVIKIKDTILKEKKASNENLRKSLKNQVDNAYNISMSIYKNNQNKTNEEIILLIKDALREIRFNEGRGYLFVYENKGKVVLHPIKPNLEDKNLWNYQDTKGTYLLQEMYKILEKQDDTFYSWYWTKPQGDKKEYEKLGYFKKFEPFDWFIGTGEYIADFEEQLKKDLANEISDIRYKKDAYMFITTYDGKYISFYDKSLIGKSIFDLNVAVNIELKYNRMLQRAKNGGGFISYIHQNKPDGVKNVSKISFVDGIQDWQWLIGTGFYMDDFYLQLKDKQKSLEEANTKALKKLLIFSVIATAVLLLIFMYISKLLKDKFTSYREDIQKQIDDNHKKDNILAHQSKMAAMGEMIGNITHQWRQPLSNITTIVSGIIVQKELGIKNNKLENESLEKINKQIMYLSQTIDDFREFFKPQKEPEIFDVKTTIEKTLDLVEVQLRDKNITVVKDLESIEINSLENELIQVFINIFNNARDELSKIDNEKFIFIKLKKDENDIFISIRDNAGGIDLNNMDKIFEPYFSTKNPSDGTGIGLFMCEEIIVKHLDGEIYAKNSIYKYEEKEYRGAEFRIILPIN